jgi:hypothetical protein
MSRRISKHIRSNVVGYVAIFLFAMSGTAFGLAGSNTVFSDDIVNQEVKTDDIANGDVGIADLGVNSVGSGELNDGSVKSAEINDGTIATVDIADGAVNSAKITDQSVTGTDLAGTGFGNNGFNGDEEIIDGTISGFDIAGSTLSGFHIADGTLTNADLADEPSAGSASDASVIGVPAGGVTVVSAPITTHGTGRILIDASAELQGADADERAQCSVRLDGSTVGLFYESTFDDIGTGNEATVSVNSAATGVAPGAHTVSMFCSALSGTITKDDAGINATGISG